jgi:hypothetical protein
MIIVVVILVIIVVMALVILVVVMILVVSMICMILMVIMICMIIVVINVNLAVEVLRFSPNQGGSNSSFNRQTATRTQTPLEHSTEQTIKRIMLGFVVEILFKTTMPLESHHRGELKLTGLRCISTSPMVTVGESCPSLNQRQKK